jgi:hypothetical protein
MKHITFLLCEGPHDVAFLSRILKTKGFNVYSKKLSEYPKPIDKFIMGHIQSLAIEDMNLEELRNRPMPSEALTFGNQLFLLYSMHGDSKKELRQDMIRKIKDLIPKDADEISGIEDLHLSIVYFFDADEKGVDSRLIEIKKEIADVLAFPVNSGYFETNASIHIIKQIIFGAYIFARNDQKGKLEDILVPLMIKDNEDIFNKANDYLLLMDENRLRKLKIFHENENIFEKRTSKKMSFDLKKSSIGVAGQLQNSGKSNVVIIKDCDYITLEKIQNSDECCIILDFFEKLLNKMKSQSVLE